jgi:predicted transport protein
VATVGYANGMPDLGTVVDLVVAKTKSYSTGAFNEQNTCAVLVEPILAALGWDTGDVTCVDRQYKVYDGTRLDYALKLAGRPILFVEAKGLEQSLDDAKFIAQTVNYANNEGVLWCVLTNGLVYRVYRTNEPVQMVEKLMLEIDLAETTEPSSRAATLENLRNLSQEHIAAGVLDRLAELVFTGGRVREALEGLLKKPTAAFRKALEQSMHESVDAERLDRILGYFSIQQRSPNVHAMPPAATPGPEPPTGPRPQYGKSDHLGGKPTAIVDLFNQVEDRVRALGDVRETFTKMYVNFSAPKHSFMTVCVVRDKIYLYFSIPWGEAPKPRPDRMRDVSQIGHYGMGDTEFVLSGADQLDDSLLLAAAAFDRNRPKA